MRCASLQCWVKKLYCSCFHGQNIIQFHLLAKYFGSHFKFQSDLHFKDNVLKSLPSFYKQMLMKWKKNFIAPPATSSRVLSQFCDILAVSKLIASLFFPGFLNKKILILSPNYFSSLFRIRTISVVSGQCHPRSVEKQFKTNIRKYKVVFEVLVVEDHLMKGFTNCYTKKTSSC